MPFGRKQKIPPIKSRCGALIVAAGSGTRMGYDINKVFLPIEETPLILYTISAFEATDEIDEIVIVTRECDIPLANQLIQEGGFSKVKTIAAGGATRCDSCRAGISEFSSDIEIIAVHDGARPFVTPSLIKAVLKDAESFGAAISAVPVKDTVKAVNSDGYITETPPRDGLYLAQTPQAFKRDVIFAAYAFATENGILATDDSSLVEAMGGTVKITMGSYDNIKITTPEDLKFAEAILCEVDEN